MSDILPSMGRGTSRRLVEGVCRLVPSCRWPAPYQVALPLHHASHGPPPPAGEEL